MCYVCVPDRDTRSDDADRADHDDRSGNRIGRRQLDAAMTRIVLFLALAAAIATPELSAAKPSRCSTACATLGAAAACDACLDCESSVAKSTTCPTVCGQRPQDEVFLLSTRHLSCGSAGLERPNWNVWLLNDTTWTPAPTDALFAPQPGVRTVVYVHGNRVDANYAVEGGLRVYRNLIPCADDAPIRFIIWSWCADQIRGPIKDARLKANVADHEAVLFGRFLSRFENDDHVGLIGFSYGSRIVTGGVHLIGGGTWCGYRVPDTSLPNLHITLWAAAEGNDWLLPCGNHSAAVPICGDWLIAINCCDPALRRYPMFEKGVDALGYTGLNASAWGDYAKGIRQMQVSHLVGCDHQSRIYPESPGVMAATRAVVLRPAPIVVESAPASQPVPASQLMPVGQ